MAGLGSLSKSLITKLGERKSQVCLLELDDTDKPVGDYLVFQYFPESISDTKAINLQSKDIPGGSLPLYQWVSSGERAISFEAVFTSDVDLTRDQKSVANLKAKGAIGRNVDCRSALTWLRRYMLPRYEDDQQLGVPLTKAPRKAMLYIPNSGIGLYGGSAQVSSSVAAADTNLQGTTAVQQSGLQDAIPVLMSQCDITMEAFFPSGLLRVAVVQLQFLQIAQLAGQVVFPRDNENLSNVVSQGSGGVFPYPIRATFK